VDMSLCKEVVDFWREPARHVILFAVICFRRVILSFWRGRYELRGGRLMAHPQQRPLEAADFACPGHVFEPPFVGS